jgi:hypothetical protein
VRFGGPHRDAVCATLLAQMLAQQLAGMRIEQAHEHRVPLHMDLAPDPTRQRSIVSRLNLDAAIQVNRALAVLVVAERLQRQRLQRRRTSPPPAAWSGPWMRVSAQRSSQSSTGVADPRGMKRVSTL